MNALVRNRLRARAAVANPMKLDPTRTTMIRRRFEADMARRFASLRADIVKLVEQEDAFGLRPPHPFAFNAGNDGAELATNTRWKFKTDDAKVKSFREWLDEQVDKKILTTDGNGKPWTATYVHSGYRQGAVRAYLDTKPDLGMQASAFVQGSKAQFLNDAFSQPEAIAKLELLATRSFEELKGVTTQMATNMNRVLSDAIAHGKNPREVARVLVKEVDMSKARALRVARTELIHAHAEGQLDSFERLGVDELGVEVEWSTAGDNRVCPQCRDLAGTIRSVKEARGMIPRHPNCRCAWIPYLGERGTLAPAIKKSGSQAAEIERVMGDEPKTAKQLAEESGVPDKRVQRHLRVEVKRGNVEKTPQGYKLTEKGKATDKPVRTKPQAKRVEFKTAKKDEGGIPEIVKQRDSVQHLGATSDAFKKRVDDALAAVPEPIRDFVEKKSGIKVVTGETLVEIDPTLKGITPRGWTPGSTWDEAEGLFDPSNRSVVVSEKRYNPYTKKYEVSGRTQGVVMHEYGHAVDLALKDPDIQGELSSGFKFTKHLGSAFSEKKEFRAVYDLERDALLKPEKASSKGWLEYFVQPGNAGPSEAMAEGFAIATNGVGAGGSTMAEEFVNNFPNTFKLIKEKVAELAGIELKAAEKVVIEETKAAAKAVEKVAVKVPKHITFSGGEGNEFAQKVWSEIGEDGIKSESHARRVGKVFREELEKGLEETRKLASKLKSDDLDALEEFRKIDAKWKKAGGTFSKKVQASEEVQKLFIQREEAVQRANMLRKELADAEKSLAGEVRARIQDTLRQVRDVGGHQVEFRGGVQSLKGAVQKAVDDLPHDWGKSLTNLRMSVEKATDRACYKASTRVLSIHDADDVRTATHELMHALEDSYGRKITSLEQEFITNRLKPGELVESIGGRSDEHGYKDSFKNHYMGRVYKSDMREVLSMGMEGTYHPEHLHLSIIDDPDYLDFVLGILVGV